MSSLWTPGGERPIRREPEPGPGATPGHPGPQPGAPGQGQPTEEDMRRQMAELRDQLAGTPAEVVVANHAYGLFELAALHLSLDPPQLEQARVAIDALGYLVEGLGPRLGEPAEELTAALAQLRMAYVQMHAAMPAPADTPAGQEAPGASGGTAPPDQGTP